MIAQALIALVALSGLAAPALADDASTPKLPTFAAYPPDASPVATASPWAGFYAGSEIIAAASRHSKGLVGGDVFIGYRRALPNDFVIAFQMSTGFSPGYFQDVHFAGYNFAQGSVKVGYQMGRLTPYLTAGVGFARPTTSRVGGYAGAGNSVNDLFGPGGDLRAYGTVGAGFDYAVTNNLSVGVGVSAGSGRGGLLLAP